MEFIEKLYAIINFISFGPISYWWWNLAKKSIFIVEHKIHALHRQATLDRNQTQSTHVDVLGVENPKAIIVQRFDDKATSSHSLSNGKVQPNFDEGHGEERLTTEQLSLPKVDNNAQVSNRESNQTLTSTHSELTAEQTTRVEGSTSSTFELRIIYKSLLKFLKYKTLLNPLIPCKPPEKSLINFV
jgi:hypothetical protein